MIYYYADADGNERSIDYGDNIPGFLVEQFEKTHIVISNLTEFARMNSREFLWVF